MFTQKKFGIRKWIDLFFQRIFKVDPLLFVIVLALFTIGFISLFSASYSFPWRLYDQLRNIVIAIAVLLFFTNVPIGVIQKLSIPIFIGSLLLLVATLFFGVTIKGATRWLDLGLRIQPSEIAKLAVPMMLAWYFHFRKDSYYSFFDYLIAFLILLIPVALIIKQPDLGTSILVMISGLAVIFFAGIHLKFIVFSVCSLFASLPVLWLFLHDYQKQRILTLINPEADPLGKGFHTLQSLIAIGSGGLTGKGWMEGTQTHLDFIPERTSDFLFAVFSEEFGFVGNLLLIFLYMALITRGFNIALNANSVFSRLLAASLTTIFFAYAFVNIGMVSGVLPVVGVPLPFMSYGGTALIILAACTGILLSISAESKERI